MATYRMFTDGEGKAQWEPIDLEAHPEWLEGFDTTKIRFAARAQGVKADWHPAPQRQFVIILSGHLEIGFEDGSTRVFGPGDARLMEDLTGRGHTTTAIGDEPCITATIGLKDQG
jgi:hypothetical protein